MGLRVLAMIDEFDVRGWRPLQFRLLDLRISGARQQLGNRFRNDNRSVTPFVPHHQADIACHSPHPIPG
jgi:hypothetical protein